MASRIPRKFISLPIGAPDKEKSRLGSREEEEGNGKEGRELFDFLAAIQKQIVPEPGIVGAPR